MSETTLSRSDLAQLLVSLEVPPDWYSLDGGHWPERYELDRRGERWVVYYSERGLETGLVEYDSEGQACSAFLTRIRRDLKL